MTVSTLKCFLRLPTRLFGAHLFGLAIWAVPATDTWAFIVSLPVFSAGLGDVSQLLFIRWCV